MGDAKATLRKLNDFLSIDQKDSKHQWAERAKILLKEWEEEFRPAMNSNSFPIRVERLCKEITEFLPHNAILVADTGYSGIWTGTMIYITHPGQSYIRAAGSLGWAFPASLGAKCAAPDRPVICFTGDGGFFYHISELETASRFGINTITIVNNNQGLRQSREGVNQAYRDRHGNREEMYVFKSVNFARIAQEMGCLGIRVEHPEEIAGALKKALTSDFPTVIDIVTDPSCKAPSPWVPS
jgi:acetolactate synthase-1/2/3 large subunit